MARWGSYFAWVIAYSVACAGQDAAVAENDVVVDTTTALERAQYDANLAFLRAYEPTCRDVAGPKVIVTGFSRFAAVYDNPSGRMVEALVGATYPINVTPSTEVSPPVANFAAAMKTVDLGSLGKVTVCGLILPTYWDVAPVIVAKELESFKPDFVLMNGVLNGLNSPVVRLELGSANVADIDTDGSSILRSFDLRAEQAPLVRSGPATLPSLLSFYAVDEAMTKALSERPVLQMKRTDFGGFPSSYLVYLCNNLIYVTNYLMENPGRPTTLLEASRPIRGRENSIVVTLANDFRRTPRVFVHWPQMDPGVAPAAAEVLLEAIRAQLTALREGPAPVRGDQVRADQR